MVLTGSRPVAGLPPLLGFGNTALVLVLPHEQAVGKLGTSAPALTPSKDYPTPKAKSVFIAQRAGTSEFLVAVNRIRLSQMIRDPFVAAAFKAAEDDGLAPDLIQFDHPKTLDGGAAEVAPDTGRRVRALVEA
jgi:hypothetical protein